MSRRDSLDSDTSEEPSDRGVASDAVATAAHVAVPQACPFPQQESGCVIGSLNRECKVVDCYVIKARLGRECDHLKHGPPYYCSGKRLLETVVQVGRPSPAKFPILAIIEKTVRPLFT